ncbi:MAG: hypothetical protein GXP29_05300 [Planctomycetes bacterium]|nr:hypothetical protein [Planctomycetota bacterium]
MKYWSCLILAAIAFVPAGCELFAPPANNRLDADAGPDRVVPLDEPISLTATATGGTGLIRFRWNLEGQPDGSIFVLTDANTNALLDIGPLTENGRYLFRVRATDAAGQTDASFASVLVGGDLALTATTVETLRVIGESTQLDALVDVDTTGFSNLAFSWEVIEGDAEIDDPSAQSPRVTVNSASTVRLRVNVTGIENGIERFGVQDVFVVGISDTTPQVIIENTGSVEGRIVMELLTEAAPNTCANFLRYVDDGYYNGIIWHRVVTDFVIQGGTFERDDSGAVVEKSGIRPTFASEANNGFSNLRSSMAMALRGTDSDSATNQFFINLSDNSNLDEGEPSFTVFARVIEGMDVADEIVALPAVESGEQTDRPLEDVVMSSVTRAESKIPTTPPDDIRVVDTNGLDDANSNGTDDADTNGMNDEDAPTTVTVTASLPIQVVGQTVQLDAIIENQRPGMAFTWISSNGLAEISNVGAFSPTATIRSSDSIVFKVFIRNQGGGAPIRGRVVVVGIPDELPRVVIENEGGVDGNITLELLTQAAPGTCANFLRYVDSGFYSGIVWHRVATGFVIQAGGFIRDNETLVRAPDLRDPIQSEANNGESNIRGTVAVALRGSDANSGTSQIFINLDDNSNLDNGSPPFTVFARVVDGMNVVDEIEAVDVGSDSGMTNVPTEDIVVRRVDP